MLSLVIATHTYSNVADSIIIKNTTESSILKIERLEAGSTLKIKDEAGITLHKEKISNSGFYSKSFDLGNLPDATYYFELDNENEIIIVPVIVKNQKTTYLKNEEQIIAKPTIKVEDRIVYVLQNSSANQKMDISIYYEGNELAYKDSVKDAMNFKKGYDFSGSLRGDYTIVVNTMGRSFSNQVSIP
jgi:hypothetical protein